MRIEDEDEDEDDGLDDSDASLNSDICEHDDDTDSCDEECLECGHECCEHNLGGVCFVDDCDCCGFVNDDDLGEEPLDFDPED